MCFVGGKDWKTWRRPTLPWLEPQYHGRWGFSRPSSGWDRVRAPRLSHQVVQSIPVVGVQSSVFSRQLSDGLDGSVLVRLFSGLTRGSVCAETSEDDFHAWCVSAIVTGHFCRLTTDH